MDKPLKKNPLSLQLDPNLFQEATEEEKAQQVITRESVSFMRDALRRLSRNKISMVCVITLILIALVAFVVPSIYPYNYAKQDVTAQYLAPMQYSQKEMAKIEDIIYALPDVLIVILLSVAIKDIISVSKNPLIVQMGAGMISIFIVFGLLYWVGMARQVRGQILSIKEQEYVLASRSIGASPSRIIRKHMIPNCVSVIIITAAMQIPYAIFTESFLSFLGLGVSIPMPSLGSLASDARSGLVSYPYLLIWPALSIFLIVLSFNLLGNGLRDAFDPKLRS